ncbi:L7Ae/L30e/S12e/Gadd45 family ribosomal protein [Caloranaerobacter ferrireducens]|uniref:L7Ae/L30e/S12e/Gadd45 family ribosomal protein n=1 Tax=Caloranaerobacter ferrireducens TaxID=1323370 RepID=UPI00084D4173|nr:ribosomal L7Ae/L30e/S12e/Gadd45 family protein [Caloranaerobacter ferrireducens]
MNKFYSLLGLCMKAGHLKFGEMGCEIAIKKRKCRLLIIANDASENTKNKFIKLTKRYGIKQIIYGDKDALGSSIGKGLISTIAICDDNFSKAIVKLL